ncbi:rhomboid family intramembrane serine protease [Sorangium sp. So ce260]|uniref:rhomboid family intramembrane serine protease n=1 Tax=Sorangium sp. So ce260 TaxID=3133291 RepID=UPI003F645F22
MTAGPSGEPRRSLHCARCGALNGSDFSRCIRCGAPLVLSATRAAPARGFLDGRSLLATKILGALTSFVFVGQMMAAQSRDLGLLSAWDAANYLRFGALLITPGAPFEPFRLLSAVFVHMGVLHFGMNMMTLGMLARAAEPAVGSARFAIAYVLTGLFGFVASAAWNVFVQPEVVCTAGASGAVFGVMGLLLGWLLRRRDPRWKDLALQAVFYIVLFGFVVNASNTGIRINNAAHIGGLASGALLGVIYAGPARSRFEGVMNAGALAGVLACLAALGLAQRSPVWRAAESIDGLSRLDAPGRGERGEPGAAPREATGALRPRPAGSPAPDGP